MSTNPADHDPVKIGIMCYLHLWASLHKHVQATHDEIAQGIGLWDDQGGGYFAAFTYENKRLMQSGQTYVCALGDEGPIVGQLDKIPPCTPITLDTKITFLLNGIAQGGSQQSAETTMKQVDVITQMIANDLPVTKKKSVH